MQRKIKINKSFKLGLIISLFFGFSLIFSFQNKASAASSCVNSDGTPTLIEGTQGYTSGQCKDYCESHNITRTTSWATNDCEWSPDGDVDNKYDVYNGFCFSQSRLEGSNLWSSYTVLGGNESEEDCQSRSACNSDAMDTTDMRCVFKTSINTEYEADALVDAMDDANAKANERIEAEEDNSEILECGVTTWWVCLFTGLLGFVKLIFAAALAFFNWTVGAENLSFIFIDKSTIVYTAWSQIKNLLNIAFILILLFSAFATIFQVEKYNYKKILLTLIIMALLVNFSYPITRILIDLSNVIMYDIAKYLIGNGSIDTLLTTASTNSHLNTFLNRTYTVGYGISGMLADIVFIFILAITFLALGILFFVRIIALIILLIFSSVAFVAAILPDTKKMASKWWDNFFRYAFFGPIMMFMIYIAFELLNAMSDIGFDKLKTSSIGITNQIESNTLASFAFLAVPIIILWIGMGVANSMSIAGSKAVMGKAQGILGGMLKGATGATLHWTNRKMAETKGLRYLSPMAIKDAWKKRSDRADRKALSASSGRLQNAMNRAIGHVSSINPFIGASRLVSGFRNTKGNFFQKAGGGVRNVVWQPSDLDRTDYNFIEQQRFVGEERKRLMDTNENSDYILHEMKQAALRKDAGDQAIIVAGQMILAKNNDFNEYAGSKGKSTIPQELKTDLIRDLRSAGMTSTENMAKTLISTGEVAFGSGGFGYGGMGTFISEGSKDKRKIITLKNFRTLEELNQVEKGGDFENPNHDKAMRAGFYFTTEEEQASTGAGKFSNLEPQARQRTTHPDSFYEIAVEDGRPVVKDVHLGGLKTFGILHASDIKNAERARDSLERHAQAWNLYNDPKSKIKEKIDSLPNADTVKAFLERAHEIQNKPKI